MTVNTTLLLVKVCVYVTTTLRVEGVTVVLLASIVILPCCQQMPALVWLHVLVIPSSDDNIVDCSCFMPGVSDLNICNPSTGACICKDNVDVNINTYCNTCMDGFWNITNPVGCQGIACH